MPATFTNKHGIPEEFERLLMVDRHVTQGDISVTQLIDAPQIRTLKREHQYELDVADMLSAFLGTALHNQLELSEVLSYEEKILDKAIAVIKYHCSDNPKLLEKLAEMFPESFDGDFKEGHNINEYVKKYVRHISKKKDPDFIPPIREQTLTIEVDGMVVSGTQDYYCPKRGFIKDYKVTSVWLGKNKEEVKKFERQQNVYAAMRRENGYDVNGLFINAVYRDFNSAEAKRSKGYPKLAIEEFKLDLWSHEEAMEYIRNRVKLHKAAEQGNVIECTAKERWAKQDHYAVKKKGGKRALPNSVTTSIKEAEKFVALNEDKYKEELIIEHRPGGNKRCEEFCPVRSVCPQYKSILEELNNKTK